MFGRINVIRVLELRNAPADVGSNAEGAVARLLDATDRPRIEKWVQFPKALFVFLVVPGDSESGAFYVYDRRSRVWFWPDFDDEKFGGYTVGDFDCLVRECRFLDIVERPHLLASQNRWIVEAGLWPRQSSGVAEPMGASRRVRDGYTIRELGLCLGEGHHKIAGWIQTGWLQDRLQGTRRHGGNGNDIHRIREKDLLNFIRNHPREINLGKVDQTWFLDLVLLRGHEVLETKFAHDVDRQESDATA